MFFFVQYPVHFVDIITKARLKISGLMLMVKCKGKGKGKVGVRVVDGNYICSILCRVMLVLRLFMSMMGWVIYVPQFTSVYHGGKGH